MLNRSMVEDEHSPDWLLTARCAVSCGRGLILVVLMALFVAGSAWAQDESPLDMRILVDVSSDMSENDPSNLRVPAVHLLIELLPSGSRAGLWTFGRDVNMLVPYGTVNDEWRINARQRAAEIGSPGFNSNIGGAMETAAFDFDWSMGFNPKEYILLSDGVVDVPPDAEASREERSRILNELVPRFHEHNAVIHTVRLSDQADELFMQQLAAQTGGNDRLARGPQDLLGLFLQVLDMAVGDQEEVMLDDQQTFLIDDSISEFTATILHDGTRGLTLISPSGERYTTETPPGRADWLSRDSYDLITMRQPEPGEWQLEGELSPQSRITVISDLNLQVDTIPLNASVGVNLPIRAVLNDVDGQITDIDFLNLVDVSVSLREQGETRSSELLTQSDGEYATRLRLPEQSGTYQLVVEADGQTFQRRRVHTVNIREPLSLEISPGDNAYELSVYPNLPELNQDIRRLLAEIETPDGNYSYQTFEQQPSGRWMLMIEPRAGDGEYTINVDVQWHEEADRLGRVAIDPVTLDFPAEGGSPQVVLTRTLPEPEPEPLAPVDPTVSPEPTTPEPTAPEPLPSMPEPEPVADEPESAPDLDAPPESQPGFWDELFSSPSNWLPYLISAGGGLIAVLVAYAIFRRFATDDMDMDLDKGLSKEEQAVLNDIEGKNGDDDFLTEAAEKEFATRAAEATDDDIPTINDPADELPEDNEPSILDDDFDLESLGIDAEVDEDDAAQSAEEKPAAENTDLAAEPEDDPFSDDEFDLSDDEIDDMLDDSLDVDDLNPEPEEGQEKKDDDGNKQ